MSLDVGVATAAGALRLDPCNLCPRMCGARRSVGERGVCGASAEMVVARAALHFWEEPPLSGESGSGAVFFGGCPLHCVYCQNGAISGGRAGRVIGVERLAQICMELQGQGALNVNFVTPTHYALQIADAVRQARDLGFALPVVWNTSGYERVEAIGALEGTVDVYLADFKYTDGKLAARYSHAPDYADVALDALDAMLEQVGAPQFDEFFPPCSGNAPTPASAQPRMVRGVVVRHLVLPGALEASKQAVKLLFERFGDAVLYSIMNQYTPVMPQDALRRFPELGRGVSTEEYEELLDYADDLGMQEYFWQDGPAALESFVPAWDCQGV